MIKAVIFDLDDTLYPEIEYVKSGFRVVANEIEKIYGLKNAYDDLLALFYQGRFGVFDRYLQKHDLPRTEKTVGELVDVYRYHTPNISLSPEVKDMLIELRNGGYKLGIITDGRPNGQRKKIKALGLDEFIDRIIITDELGSVECRKPNPKAFEMMCAGFRITPEEMMYVGDNPQKDFAVKAKLAIKTARIVGGIYGGNEYTNGIKPDYTIEKVDELCDLVRELSA